VIKFGERLWLISWTGMGVLLCGSFAVMVSGYRELSLALLTSALGFGCSMVVGMGICLWGAITGSAK
jgi:hypothetical protein